MYSAFSMCTSSVLSVCIACAVESRVFYMCKLSVLRLALCAQHFLYVYNKCIVNVSGVSIQSHAFCMCVLSALRLALTIQHCLYMQIECHFLYMYMECIVNVHGVCIQSHLLFYIQQYQ